jgi:23S rRNA (cytidine1920-2'-O)/16S rRNA (cytidine1409-2'-O)-methyltransferase
MTIKRKERLDILVLEKFPQYSRQQVQSWIMQGNVTVDDKVVTKPGMATFSESVIDLVVDEPKYVSRAGLKLEKALDHFGIDVKDLVALDAGLSTGGFADCLLQRGAKKVFGVDVGYGQTADKIRQDPRVIMMERTNLRTLETVGELVDIITLDLAFISVLKVMDAVEHVIKPYGKLIVLIKPQFEAEKHEVGAKGIIKDPKIHEKVIIKLKNGIEALGYECVGVIDSPILGGSGNKEFLGYFRRK